MEQLLIEREKNTPFVNFDPASGNLEMKGTCIPEDSHKFFYPLTKWVEAFVSNSPSFVSISFQFDYMNTSSSKWVLKISQILADYHKKNNCVVFNWYYDESDLYDTGHYYQSLLEVEFNFIEYR